jgi:hypothetical protein
MLKSLDGEEFSSKQREHTPLSNVAFALDAFSERLNAAVSAKGMCFIFRTNYTPTYLAHFSARDMIKSL